MARHPRLRGAGLLRPRCRAGLKSVSSNRLHCRSPSATFLRLVLAHTPASFFKRSHRQELSTEFAVAAWRVFLLGTKNDFFRGLIRDLLVAPEHLPGTFLHFCSRL